MINGVKILILRYFNVVFFFYFKEIHLKDHRPGYSVYRVFKCLDTKDVLVWGVDGGMLALVLQICQSFGLLNEDLDFSNVILLKGGGVGGVVFFFRSVHVTEYGH